MTFVFVFRALNFVVDFLRNLFLLTPSDASSNLAKEAATKAYASTLREFHNWSVRGTATVS